MDKSTSEMMREANAAMHRAKRAGGRGYRFFSRELNEDARDRVLLAGALRHAISDDELALVYQPQVSSRDGRVVGLEALVRWNHPTEGLLMPGRFIPVAEDTGLIDALGEWVLLHACRQARDWLDAGMPFGQVAVNVAPQQIQSGRIVTATRDALAATGLPPERLEIEITETTMMSLVSTEQQTLEALLALGVRISMDDFGTGYSSLAKLRRMKTHAIKIDKSFVDDIAHDPAAAQIISSVAHLARNLGLWVVMEGVETAEQVAFLRECRCCDSIQGFYFSRPVAPEQIPELLSRPFALDGTG